MKNEHQLFIKIAQLVEQQSTCCRLQVGAILVKENRIISMGFNGTPSGQIHCEDYFNEIYKSKYKNQFKTFQDFIKSDIFYNLHGEFSTDNELHAEQNAITFAAKSGISTQNSDIYVTYSPCAHCAKIIVSAGIKRVFYKNLYDRTQSGIKLLQKNGIHCEQLILS